MKQKVKVVYLDHDGYMNYQRDVYERRALKFNPEFHERMFRQARKKTINGVEYWPYECHPEFQPRKYWDIAEKYGFPVIEEIEWINL